MEIDDRNIYAVIIQLMEYVEKIDAIKTGESKKNYVLNCLYNRLGEESFNRYKPFIILTIDFIIEISKGNIILHLNKVKNKFCCFKNL